MKKYSVEDIEYIRSKTGISYEEAIKLFDAHNGNVLDVMVELKNQGEFEKNNTSKTSHINKKPESEGQNMSRTNPFIKLIILIFAIVMFFTNRGLFIVLLIVFLLMASKRKRNLRYYGRRPRELEDKGNIVNNYYIQNVHEKGKEESKKEEDEDIIIE